MPGSRHQADGPGTPITWRHVSAMLAAAAAMLAILGWGLANVIVPQTIAKAQQCVDKALEHHEKHGHPSAVTVREFTKVEERQVRIEQKLDQVLMKVNK